MIPRQHHLPGPQQRDPTRRLQRLTRLVDDHDIEPLPAQLVAPRAVQRRQDDFALRDKSAHTPLFALPIFLSQLLEIPIDLPPLPTVSRLLDGRLFGIHLFPHIAHDPAGLGGGRQHVEGVVEHRGEQARWVAEAEDRYGRLQGGEALDDVVDGDVGGAADEAAEVADEDQLPEQFEERVCLACLEESPK